jgi:hypothetical protein
MKQGTFRANVGTVLGSELTDHAKLYLIAMLAHADTNGMGAPGQKVLAAACSMSTKTCTRVKQEFAKPWSPVRVISRARTLADGTPIPEEYRIQWCTPTGQRVPYPLGDTVSGTPKKAVFRYGTACPVRSQSLSLFKELGSAEAPIEENEKRRTAGLTPTVAKEDEQVAVAGFVPDETHSELTITLKLDGAASLTAFCANRTNASTLHTPADWARLYTGWLHNRPARLIAQASREAGQAIREAKPLRGAAAAVLPTELQPPLTTCAVNPTLWLAVVAALPEGMAVADVPRLMHDAPAVTLAVARALGVADEASTATGFTFGNGHELAVRDYITQLSPQQQPSAA